MTSNDFKELSSGTTEYDRRYNAAIEAMNEADIKRNRDKIGEAIISAFSIYMSQRRSPRRPRR